MQYFKGIDNLTDLKTRYRELALANHPDKGGAVEVMQEINAEFEVRFAVLKSKEPRSESVERETATGFRREFYTQNGWAGSRYNPYLSLKEIAAIVRGYIKDVYPTWRFSVCTDYASMCQMLYVAVTEVPCEIFDDARIREAAEKAIRCDIYGRETVDSVYQQFYETAYVERHCQDWTRCTWLTDYARTVLDDVEALVNSYNYSDCDGMIDYFNVHFYTDFDIGKYNKPLKIVPRTARITAEKGNKRAKRITA